MAAEEYPESAMIPSYRRLNVKKTVLALALFGIAAGAAQAADSQILNSLLACNASYFKAIAKDKNIPETLKIRSGDMAFLKVEKQPLDIVMFPKPFKDSGLTVTGYVFNDEIIRYPGVPDMHTHFWGLIVKEDWIRRSTPSRSTGKPWIRATCPRTRTAWSAATTNRSGSPTSARTTTNIRKWT